ncbi:hypothetical protein M408DRAFT_331166 [Serendipita vermifera MAFF 305830]|uniref:Uncharacterized protein n=1 Tax=Serendipita vermifera MAFF 305830 TaxID=933852 RepID=A0A0C3AZJ5_SERVB|nr:hypothetical protein M408DRAFT_331166 [Serendipita vermifera MAFF 305830]
MCRRNLQSTSRIASSRSKAQNSGRLRINRPKIETPNHLRSDHIQPIVICFYNITTFSPDILGII